MSSVRQPEPAILTRTIDTADGPFTIVVDAHGAVVASGWVNSADAALLRVRPMSVGKVLLGTHPAPAEISHGGSSSDNPANASETRPRRTPLNPELMRRGLDDATYAVTAYYSGRHDAPARIPVTLLGTDFQVTGWKTLRTVPPSAPITYAELAERAGHPTAVRAAASVCARNALGLFVPCHRVVRADGRGGNFAWGSEVKHSLIRREGLNA